MEGYNNQEKPRALNPKELLRYAQDTTEAGRYKLASAISGFFDEKDLSRTEQVLAADIVLNLVKQAALDLREALAERLSVQDNVPADVIVHLANDVISVARPVLQHSPVLTDAILIQIIASKNEDYWRSIAERSHLSSVVAYQLVDTGDPATVMNLIDNQRVALPKNCVKKMIRVAMKSEELQAPLLRRPEIDGDMAVDLYMCVSHALRQEITERFHMPPSVIETAMEMLVTELCMEAKGVQQTTLDMMALARRFRERDEISPDLMIKTLRRGQKSFFIALFSEKTGLPPEAVVSLIQKDGGMPFVTACRSIGMMKSEFASIFLLSRGIRTGDKIVDQRELAMALKSYDSMKDFDVKRTLKQWIKNPESVISARSSSAP